jgi:hypothetical protein
MMISCNIPFAIICLVVILAITDAFNVPSQSKSNAQSSSLFWGKDYSSIILSNDDGNKEDDIDIGESESCYNRLSPSRRMFIQRGIATTTATIIGAGTATGTLSLFSPQLARASAASEKEKVGLMTTSDVAELLHPIPTFIIVDGKGVPFTVVGEDAKVTGYFFTSYPEASRILRLAKTSADKSIAKMKKDGEYSLEEIGSNPWKKARISTVPLDYAVTIVSKSNRMVGGGVYFKIAPAEEDVNNALAVTGDDDLSEGKVPLFYYEDFTININSKGDDADEASSKKKSPLYFRKDELEKEWRRLNPKKEAPKVSVTEFFSVLTELVRPDGTDNELLDLVFMTPKESETKRMECVKKGGNEAPFVIGKRIIVL